jgi:nitrogen fixation/metabolism regulation signal transduction histidine kinase
VSQAVVIMLMLFATVGFAGAGVAYAVARAREQEEAESDLGMRAVAMLLLVFAAVCTFVALGFSAIFAFGGVISWFSYMVSAQRVGVFRLQPSRSAVGSPAEPGRII